MGQLCGDQGMLLSHFILLEVLKHLPIQANVPMQPFCNKGWAYLSQMELILLVSGTKGCNVFVASAATSSSQMIANQLNISNTEAEDLPDAIKAARNIRVGSGDGGQWQQDQ